jgi:hypothetical protein
MVIGLLVTVSGTGSGTATTAVSITESEPFIKAGAKAMMAIEVLTEAITYYPGGDLAAGKSIRAIVQRTEPEIIAYTMEAGSLTVDVELWIVTDAVLGVSTVNAGQDLADIVVTDGKAAERVRVVEIIDHDPGMVHLLAVR